MYSITFGILIVSDTCHEDKSKDASGPEVERAVTDLKGQVRCKDIVPDDEKAIMNKLIDWSDNCKVDVIITSGGTGFAERDVTPEATKKIIDKEAPGIASVMLHQGCKVTPLAMLSRAVCGIRGKTLIINLPGSPKAVKENLGVIAEIIPHAVALILNDKTKILRDHQSLQAERKLNDLTMKQQKLEETLSDIANRPRQSEFPMISVDEAKKMITDRITLNKVEIEEVSLEKCYSRILATAIQSDCDLPSFRASIKDGYAVIAADGAGERIVLEGMEAGQEPRPIELKTGQCVRVNTGAPLPEGATAVVQVEDTELCDAKTTGKIKSEEKVINILVAPQENQDIRAIGSDIKKGMIILEEKTRIGAAEVGILAACGITKIPVFKLPVVGILSTGNELQEPGEEQKPNHVYDSNKITLITTLKERGYDSIDFGIVKDDAKVMVNRISKALNLVDVLITTGSVSMGDKDMLKPILREVFGASIHFGRVNMKPGKPTTFATCSYNGTVKYLLCLPGNPVSAMVTAHLFAIPLLNGLSHNNEKPAITYAKLEKDYPLDPRPEYARATISFKTSEAYPVVKITGNQISSRLLSCKSANALLVLPAKEPKNEIAKSGSLYPVMLLGFNEPSSKSS